MANWVQTKPLAERIPPDSIQAVISTLRSVIQTLVAILGITDAILNIIKIFALGIQNPLAAILNALAAQLQNILEDLQRAGVYIHGDFYDLKWPFEELLGGYEGYEQRMVRRLTDPTDPERPIFSQSSSTVALFLYLRADATGVFQVVQFILQLMDLFGKRDANPVFPAVADVEVGYGWDGLTLASLPVSKTLNPLNVSRRGVPTIANISWSLLTTGRFRGIRRFAPPISGFLIEVSVYENGLIPVYSAPLPSNTDLGGTQYQRFGRYLDNRKNPIVVYGGADQIDAEGVSYNDAISGGEITPGARTAYLVRNLADTVPIDMGLLKDGDRYLLQRTFFVKSTASRILYLNQKFTFRLRAEDLPYNADFEVLPSGEVQKVAGSVQRARTVYVRIRPVSKAVSGVTDFAYQFRPVVVDPAYAIPTLPIENQVGDAYGPYEVSFPSESDSSYFDHMRSALTVMTLTRPDLDPKAFGAKGLEGTQDLQRRVTGRGVQKFYSKADTSDQFRKQINNRISAVMAESARYLGTLPESYKKSIVDRTEILASWKWTDVDPQLPDLTITGAVDSTSVEGVSRNLNSIYDFALPENQASSNVVLRLLEQRNAIDIGVQVASIRKNLPVIVATGRGGTAASQIVSGKVADIRSTIPEEVYNAASLVLRAANVPYARVPGGWIQVRLFQQAIPGIDDVVQSIIDFVDELNQGISGIIDAIIDYIEFLQARVRELSELLLRIDAYLQFLLNFQIPSVNALFIAGANGTDGIVDGLINSGNQPENDPNEYVGGIVLVSGGLPSFVTEIIQAVAG